MKLIKITLVITALTFVGSAILGIAIGASWDIWPAFMIVITLGGLALGLVSGIIYTIISEMDKRDEDSGK